MRNTLAALFAGAVLALGNAAPAQSVEITLLRFFGDCAGEYSNVTDLEKAVGECGIIQVLTNKFNAENDLGATVRTQTVEWGTYYDQLSATYSTGSIPDVAVMHRSVLPNFTTRNLVEPVADGFAEVGVDTKDFAPAAREAVTVGDSIYGLPFDLHALLFHVNMDLMEQAGLVQNGEPVLPKSPEELLQHAKQMKEKTGKNYFAMESGAAEFMPVRLFNSWVWQQGQDVIAADGSSASLNTDAGKAADAERIGDELEVARGRGEVGGFTPLAALGILLQYLAFGDRGVPAVDDDVDDDGEAARITLRLPLPLKDRIESAAAREGVSVNAWLVRTLRQALTPASSAARTAAGALDLERAPSRRLASIAQAHAVDRGTN
jgi:hypothetical protein